jgi:metallophosphoesterase (TIGR00282 family)
MKLLYIGDIMGPMGVETVSKVIPTLKKDYQIDVIAAQAENVTEGKGISTEDFTKLKQLGVDFFTGGNWSLFLPPMYPSLKDPNQPIIRPANYPQGTAGLGYKYLKTNKGDILFISLLGKIVGKDADTPLDNPLKTVDKILLEEVDHSKIAVIVNFHGDYSSEKVVIGHYLDGRVTAIVGDHWHVPTADARVLPNGSAHISDVGMCGSLDSSLGIKLPIILNRWKDNIKGRNELESEGSCQFNAVLIDFNETTRLSRSIKSIREIIGN